MASYNVASSGEYAQVLQYEQTIRYLYSLNSLGWGPGGRQRVELLHAAREDRRRRFRLGGRAPP